MNVHDYRSLLGNDLWALVETLGSPLVSVSAVTTLSPLCAGSASFRLQLGDGRIMKGRRLKTGETAQKIEYLSQFLDTRLFPRVLARCGEALLTEWIDGQPLTSSQSSPDIMRRCGALHGMLHTRPLPGELSKKCQRVARDWQAKLERSIRDLVRQDALTNQEGERLLDLAATRAPGDIAVGITHKDFCAENILIGAHGDVVVIDNETLSIDAFDYDLGRTWYRWPMTPFQREAYYDGYNQYRNSTGFRTHFAYWLIAVLVRSALFYLEAGTREAWGPLPHLRRLLERDVQLWALSYCESFVEGGGDV